MIQIQNYTRKPSILAQLSDCKQQLDSQQHCLHVLTRYLSTLQDWQQKYSPVSPDEPLDPRYAEACRMLECIEYMTALLQISSPADRAELVNGMTKDNKIILIENRLAQLSQDSTPRP
jgi:hypothetical protein